MFYLVLASYAPNTAPSNRIMAYAKALSELNVKTRVVLFFPDKNLSKHKDHYENIDFSYLWEKLYINIPFIKLLSIRRYLKLFAKELKSGDVVYVYGFPDLVVELSSLKSINVFAQ